MMICLHVICQIGVGPKTIYFRNFKMLVLNIVFWVVCQVLYFNVALSIDYAKGLSDWIKSKNMSDINS